MSSHRALYKLALSHKRLSLWSDTHAFYRTLFSPRAKREWKPKRKASNILVFIFLWYNLGSQKTSEKFHPASSSFLSSDIIQRIQPHDIFQIGRSLSFTFFRSRSNCTILMTNVTSFLVQISMKIAMHFLLRHIFQSYSAFVFHMNETGWMDYCTVRHTSTIDSNGLLEGIQALSQLPN